MTIREALLQGVRNWLKLAAVLPDARVRVSEDETPRPALPYLTVKVTSHDIVVGEDEERATLGEVLTVTGGTTGTVYAVTVNGEAITYTRLVTDTTNTLAAAGLAAAIVAGVDEVYADADGATVTVSPIDGALTLTVAEAHAFLTLAADTVPVDLVHGDRRASVSINSYGLGGEAWLSTAVRRLRSASVLAQNDTDGITITPIGGLTDLSTVIVGAFEVRHLLEVELAYGFASDGETSIACGVIEVAYTSERFADDPAAFTTTISLDLEA